MEDDVKQTSNNLEWWMIVLALITGAILIGVVIKVTDKPEPDTEIPMPPPGYEFCVTADGEAIGFCRKGDQ